MNYANMIEEKNLKKGFIIATLLSTVIGTFTASMTLHDKVSEKRAKKKQAQTDKGQNDQIKEMKEKLDKLEKGGGGEGEKKDEGGKDEKGKDESKRKSRSRSRSRSRSSSRRRPPRRRESVFDDEDAYFAHNAAKSKNLIERTYQDHLQKIGPKYARGDLITENMLQAQVIQLQQTVIGVLQDALYNGRSLSEEDMKRLVAAQNTARDGSIEALQGQYERMLALEKKSLGSGQAPAPSPPGRVLPEIMPPPQPRETLADYGIPAQKRAASIHGSPIPVPRGPPPPRDSYVPEAALAGGAAGLAAGLAGGRSRHGSPPPKSTMTELPQSRKDSAIAAGPDVNKGYNDAPPPKVSKTEAGGGGGAPKSTKTEIGKSAPEDRPKSTMGERPKSVMGDAGKSTKGEAPKSTKAEGPKSTKTELNGPTKNPAHDDHGKDKAKSTKGEGAKSTKTELNGPTKSRAGGDAGGQRNDPYAEGMPPKEWYPPKKTRSHDAAPPPTLYASPPLPPPTQKARSASPKRQKPAPKALPEAPEGDLFCRYSLDLQDSKLPLHSSFSGSGNHRCPACKVLVPVDVRDVWVISTDSSSPNHKSHQKSHHSKQQPAEDYRMDARFVVKCHTAAGQDGGFACVLCDRYRDLDCLCKSVDALVKHVGSAHGPEEYERDKDLHRMKRGANVQVNGREFVLA